MTLAETLSIVAVDTNALLLILTHVYNGSIFAKFGTTLVLIKPLLSRNNNELLPLSTDGISLITKLLTYVALGITVVMLLPNINVLECTALLLMPPSIPQ